MDAFDDISRIYIKKGQGFYEDIIYSSLTAAILSCWPSHSWKLSTYHIPLAQLHYPVKLLPTTSEIPYVFSDSQRTNTSQLCCGHLSIWHESEVVIHLAKCMCVRRMAGRVKSEPYFTASLGISRMPSTKKVFRLVMTFRWQQTWKTGLRVKPEVKTDLWVW